MGVLAVPERKKDGREGEGGGKRLIGPDIRAKFRLTIGRTSEDCVRRKRYEKNNGETYIKKKTRGETVTVESLSGLHHLRVLDCDEKNDTGSRTEETGMAKPLRRRSIITPHLRGSQETIYQEPQREREES